MEYLREEDEPEKTDESEREEMALAEASYGKLQVSKGKRCYHGAPGIWVTIASRLEAMATGFTFLWSSLPML